MRTTRRSRRRNADETLGKGSVPRSRATRHAMPPPNDLQRTGNDMQIRRIRGGGRPRQPDRRRDTTTGRSRGESPAEVVAVALAQRIKAGADPDDALNALHASTLGALHRLWQMCAT